MNWLPPKDEHIVYEALSAIADGRFEMLGENKARCLSTSGGKHYLVEFYPFNNAIMSNDNMAYYRGEISYPMVAMFLQKGLFPFDESILPHLKGIKWKDINQKNGNDYMRSVREVMTQLSQAGVDTEKITSEVNRIFEELLDTTFIMLGDKKLPPTTY